MIKSLSEIKYKMINIQILFCDIGKLFYFQLSVSGKSLFFNSQTQERRKNHVAIKRMGHVQNAKMSSASFFSLRSGGGGGVPSPPPPVSTAGLMFSSFKQLLLNKQQNTECLKPSRPAHFWHKTQKYKFISNHISSDSRSNKINPNPENVQFVNQAWHHTSSQQS